MAERLSPEPTEPSAITDRDSAMDAARVLATALVVLHHTAITYGGSGGWFYRERPTDESLPSLLLTCFCAVKQAWFMGFFFLLAGYYATPALLARGPWAFLRGRLLRLGLPLLLFGCLLGPATVALAGTARGLPFLDRLLVLWREGEFIVGPLWFAWALLLLTVLTLPFARWLGRARPRPGDGVLLGAALFTGAVALALRQWWPVGTQAWSIQWGYAASYVVLYVAGLLAAPAQWLHDWPATSVQRWRVVARWTLPVLLVVALLGPSLWGLPGRVEGGLSLLSAVYAWWEPLVAWGVILGLLQRCRRRYGQPDALGRLGLQMVRRAFAVFVIHPPVVVAVALAWRGVAAPALLKFAVTGALSLLLCHVLAGLLLRVWGLRRIL